MTAGSDIPRVAVLVDTSTGWGRRLVRGTLAWVRENTAWHIWIEPRGQQERLRLPEGLTVQGVIARISDPDIARHVRDAGVPVVNVSGIQLPGGPVFARAALDDQASAEVAFQHFHSRGFRHFGYVGSLRLSYVHRHFEAFRTVLKREGMRCHAYADAARRQKARRGEVDPVEDLADWLRALPKPVAIFAWGSETGRAVVDACQDAGIPVPHDVAVLGSDYDELLSDACRPALSGIENPSEQIGREAAALLDGLMRGTADPSASILIPPLRVVERLSSDTLAIEDAQLCRVLHYIRAHATEGITVADVLAAVPMSRRALEKKMADVLGCSPAEELRRVKIDHARELLARTDLSMQDVAERCGYATYNYLSHAFKKATGLSSRAYRLQTRR